VALLIRFNPYLTRINLRISCIFFLLIAEVKLIERAIKAAVAQTEDSLFTKRTEASSAEQYFQVPTCFICY